MSGLRIDWTVREPPLPARGVYGFDDAARGLAQALLRRSEEALRELEGVCGAGFIAVLGPTSTLPWADGVVYVAPSPGAAALWMPVLAQPSVDAPLVERALQRTNVAPPLLVVPERSLLVSLSEARPISRPVLEAWLA